MISGDKPCVPIIFPQQPPKSIVQVCYYLFADAVIFFDQYFQFTFGFCSKP